MNAIGIDVSKGKSTVAVIHPFGEIVKKPFVKHTSKDLNDFILSLEGESRVVLEHTGKYSAPIAESLCKAEIFVSVVNAKLIYNYGNDTIRRDKTDKVDSLKIGPIVLTNGSGYRRTRLKTSFARFSKLTIVSLANTPESKLC